VDAFWELYATRPIEQVTIKEVAALAGVHRLTFYEYFDNVYDLLEKQEDAIIQDVRANAELARATEVDDGTTPELMARITEIYERHGERLCLLMGPGGDPSFATRLKDTLFPAFEAMRALPGSKGALLLFEFGISGLLAAFAAWYPLRERMPAREFVALMNRAVTSGVLCALDGL
jgi:AcrR family transcriptional regulator